MLLTNISGKIKNNKGVEQKDMMNKKQSLSDLLDDQCSSVDLDSLLSDDKSVEGWYRYHSVSAIIKDEYSAHSHVDFCKNISAKIADEPAIIASPRTEISHTSDSSNNVVQLRRSGGGLAIAASAAFATFFSVQTLQVSDQITPDNQTVIANNSANPIISDSKTLDQVSAAESLEQSELEFFNELYIQEANRPVGGEYVKTFRFSAEQWQQILQNAARQQSKLQAEEAEDTVEQTKD